MNLSNQSEVAVGDKIAGRENMSQWIFGKWMDSFFVLFLPLGILTAFAWSPRQPPAEAIVLAIAAGLMFGHQVPSLVIAGSVLLKRGPMRGLVFCGVVVAIVFSFAFGSATESGFGLLLWFWV